MNVLQEGCPRKGYERTKNKRNAKPHTHTENSVKSKVQISTRLMNITRTHTKPPNCGAARDLNPGLLLANASNTVQVCYRYTNGTLHKQISKQKQKCEPRGWAQTVLKATISGMYSRRQNRDLPKPFLSSSSDEKPEEQPPKLPYLRLNRSFVPRRDEKLKPGHKMKEHTAPVRTARAKPTRESIVIAMRARTSVKTKRS